MLRQALATIVNQTHRPLEVVVVEGRGDDSRDACAAFADQLEVRHLRLDVPRDPLALANHGLADARGEWLGILDDDDRLYADHVEVLLQAARYSGASAAYGMAWRVSACVVDGQRGVFDQLRRDSWPGVPAEPESLPLAAVLFHRGLHDRHGGFVEGDEPPHEGRLWARYARFGAFVPVSKHTSLYRVCGPVERTGS